MGNNHSDLNHIIDNLYPEQVIEITEKIWGKTMFDVQKADDIEYLKKCLKINKSTIKYNYISNVSKSPN
tara:strand:- start:312 stop:518 length:207 start_codon:yes stop_codon:yes gene_type:complete